MIWLTDNRRQAIAAKAAAETSEWQSFRAICDVALDSVREPKVAGWELNLALMAVITRQEKYAKGALSLIQDRARLGLDAISYDQTYYGHYGGVRDIVPAMCAAMQWLCEGCSYAPAIQAQLEVNRWIRTLAYRCWPETQASDNLAPIKTYGRDHPGGNFYVGFLGASWLAGIHLRDDFLIKSASHRFTDEFLPFQDSYQPVGVPQDGMGYGVESWMRLALMLDVVQAWPGWNDRLWTMLEHLTMPGGNRLVLIGDNARITPTMNSRLMPTDDYARIPAAICYQGAGAITRAGLRIWWERNQEPARFPWLAWTRMLFPVDPVVTLAGLPASDLVSRGNGIAVARSSAPGKVQTPNDAMIVLQAPRITEDHQDKAPGSLQIIKGGEVLIGPARYWERLGELGRATIDHCTLLMPPNHVYEPCWRNPDYPLTAEQQSKVAITHSDSTDDYFYVAADLTGAYAYPVWDDNPAKRVQNPLVRWHRNILFDRVTETVLVVDEVIRKPGAPAPRFQYISPGVVVASSSTWIALNGVSAALVSPGSVVDKTTPAGSSAGVRVDIPARVHVGPDPTPENPDAFVSVVCIQISPRGLTSRTDRFVRPGINGVILPAHKLVMAIPTRVISVPARENFVLTPPGAGFNSSEDALTSLESAILNSEGDMTWTISRTQRNAGDSLPDGYRYILADKSERTRV